MAEQAQVKVWKRAMLTIVLAPIPTLATCEQFVLVCSLDTVNSDGDNLGHDRFTLHVDTNRNTVDGDPARIDEHYIRFSDPLKTPPRASIVIAGS